MVLKIIKRNDSQEENLSRVLRGKILKILKRKDSQEESFSRASRGKILKILKRKDSQEETFSRASKGKILKILKIIRRNNSQEDSQEEFHCKCSELFSQVLVIRHFADSLLIVEL